jgi:hypothetical protein
MEEPRRASLFTGPGSGEVGVGPCNREGRSGISRDRLLPPMTTL